jgi:hypothetical protein
MTLYSADFAVEGDLERVSSTLMILRGNGSSLNWRGWPGSACTLTLVNPNADIDVEVIWNGQQHKITSLPAGGAEYSYQIDFPVPFSTRLMVSSILLLAISAVMMMLTCGIMLISGGNAQPEVVNQRTTGKWQFWLLAVLLGALNIVLLMRLLVSNNPYTHFPGRDQGVFLYIGEGLLDGQTPYLDTWDHKGPLIYFINALGKLIDPAGEWGVYLLMIVFLGAAIVIAYLPLRKRAGTIPLLGGLAVFLGLILHMGAFDNLVELYALPFYALGLLAVAGAVEKNKSTFLLLFGVSAALAFSLRPNLISVFAAGGIYWLVEEIKRKGKIGRGLLLAFTGAMLVILPMVIFFGSRGALPDLYDQMFKFNFQYSSNISISIWLKITQIRPMVLPVILSGLICIPFSTGMQRRNENKTERIFLGILTISYFFELILSRLSGYDFTHYSLPLLLLSVIILISVFTIFAQSLSLRSHKTRMIEIGGLILIILGFISREVYTFSQEKLFQRQEEYLKPEIIEIMQSQSMLLVWGAETQINYLTGIESPTRYVYQYPLFNSQYCSTEIGKEFLDDVKEALPVILDTSNGNSWAPSLDVDEREQAESDSHPYGKLECLNDFFEFVQKSYSPVYTMPGHRWTIYLPNDTGPDNFVDD